jgi:hypothetical protein
MWMLFLSNFINFCSASKLLCSFLCFFKFFNLFLSSNFMKHRRNIHRSVWKLLAFWWDSKWHYHGKRGTKIMGWGDVCYIFCTLVTMATAGILNFFNTQKLSQYKVDIPTKCHEVWWKESKQMATVAMITKVQTFLKSLQTSKFVQ